MANNIQRSRSTSSNSKYVNRDAYYKQKASFYKQKEAFYKQKELFYVQKQLLFDRKQKQKQRRDNFLLCSHVLRLLIPFIGVILLFRFMYQGESASISFSNIWLSLSDFKIGSDFLMSSMELISNLDFNFSSVDNLSDFFDWLGDIFKGLFGVLSLPVALIVCAFDIVSFGFSMLFGA